MSSRIITVPANQSNKLVIYSFGPITGANGIVINETTMLNGFAFNGDSNLASVSAPNLTSVDPTNLVAGAVTVQNCASVTSISLPLLAVTGGSVVLTGNACVTLSLPSLVTIGVGSSGLGDTVTTTLSVPALAHVLGQIEIQSSISAANSFPSLVNINGGLILASLHSGASFSAPLLTTISGDITAISSSITHWDTPNFLPTNGRNLFFTSVSLDVASVNQILARCVANPAYVTGSIVLGGATPTGQGQTDKTTLIGRGVSVITN